MGRKRDMKIGIDIDNTITNTLPILKKYCQRYNDTVVKRDLQMHEEGVATYNLYDWTQEENMDFCIKYLEEVVLQAEVKENAREIIQKLKNEGHHINIISSRAIPMFKTPYETTEKFLKEKGIVYDKLIVGKVEKKSSCIENQLDVLIEDEPQHITQIAEFIPVIVFDAIYNKQCVGNNIMRVKDWNEIYSIIKKMEINRK